MRRTFRAVAPCRADLAGGTLDIWPIGLLHPGAVTVNLAVPVIVDLLVTDDAPKGVVEHSVDGAGPPTVLTPDDAGRDLTAAVAFHFRPEGGMRVSVKQQAPVGSGLGGSSAYGVALAKASAALSDLVPEDPELVRLVQNLEARILETPTGCQDHWGAVRGGVLALNLEADGDRVESLDVSTGWVGERFTVFFTGITHHSGMVNWQVIRRRLDRDGATIHAFDEIAAAARSCRRSLLAADESGVARALRREWSSRKRLAPEVCPDELQHIEQAAMAAGAAAFKACGAGGGGSILVWHEPEQRAAVEAALVRAAPNGRTLPRGVADLGCSVRLVIR